jgi:hypothetical protein
MRRWKGSRYDDVPAVLVCDVGDVGRGDGRGERVVDRIKSVQTIRTFQIELDGKWYRVTRLEFVNHDGPSLWDEIAPKPNVSSWRVFAARGAWSERECDPNKPVFKRAVKFIEQGLTR